MCWVAVLRLWVAVRVAVFFGTATHENPYRMGLRGVWVAEVAVTGEFIIHSHNLYFTFFFTFNFFKFA